MSKLHQGNTGKIAGYLGGTLFTKKLIGMGLYHGAVLKIIKEGCPGPWLIEVENNFKVAIGCSMVSKIVIGI